MTRNKYFIKAFGCQMNHSDSERIAGFLELHKFKPAKDIGSANMVIFNTCSVRQSAEDRVYGQIHNLVTRNMKLETKKIIVLTGCLANRKDVQKRLKDKIDLFCEIKEFPEKIEKLIQEKLPVELSSDSYKSQLNNYLKIKPAYNNNFSAFVPIMTGCNNFCSYCVVPCARGREVSRPADEVLSEIKKLVKSGYREIILLGQNINSYKSEMKRGSTSLDRSNQERTNLEIINFSRLIKKINVIPGDFWIQFLSNHPKDVTDEMIKTVAKCQKVCECFHIPIQAGNDEILRKMNRKYTAKQYLKLIEKIKKAYRKYKLDVPYAVTSDIIVGFPGETKKQFLDSAEIMKKAKFDMVYFGQYSPRPGTAAWKMKDNVSKKEKARREKYLNEILKKTAFENNKKYVGKVFEVLVTEANLPPNRSLASEKITYFGRTRTMKNVKIESKQKNLIGKFVKAKITKANTWNLEGIVMEV